MIFFKEKKSYIFFLWFSDVQNFSCLWIPTNLVVEIIYLTEALPFLITLSMFLC